MLPLTQEQQQRVLDSYKRSQSCGKAFLSSYNIKDVNNIKVKIHPLLCHSLFCERCNKIKRKSLYLTLLQFASKRHLRVMNLNYLNDSTQTPLDIIKRASKDWNLFVLKLRRKKYKFNYFKVIEFTKRKGLHFHVLIDSYIPVNIISSTWHETTKNSYIVWVNDANWTNQKSINYVLKYVTKSFHDSQELFVAFRLRRYSFSRSSFDFIKAQSTTTKKKESDFIFDYRKIFTSVKDLVQYYTTWHNATKLTFTNSQISFYFPT